MKTRENNQTNYELACKEFFQRYQSFLFQVCRAACYNFDSGAELAADIFQNTMIKVCKNPDKFKLKTEGDNTNIAGQLKNWLTVIARNELRDFLRKNPDELALSNRYRLKSFDVADYVVDSLNELQENECRPPSIQKRQLEFALEKLTERESHILRTYMEYFDSDQPNRHLPDEILNTLCLKYNVTVENIRQIKSRATKKIKAAILNYSNTK